MPLTNVQEFQLMDYDKKLQGIMRKAKERLSAENLSTIKKYDAEMATLGLKKSTRVKQISLIVDMTVRIDKSWKDVTKEDIDNLIRNVLDQFGDNLGGETETTRDYKKSLKPFFRWLRLGTRDYREVGDPPELKSIRMKSVKSKIVREELLTEEDHKKLLKACSNNPRDRALLDVHYDAGTRPGEILSLKIKHVKFDKNGAVIHVDGKTGPRPVRIISSVPKEYIEEFARVLESTPHGFRVDIWPEGQVFSQMLPGDYLAKSALIQTGMKHIELRALHPLDVVVTKIGRLNGRDLEDIETCIKRFGLEADEIRERAGKVGVAGSEQAYEVNLEQVINKFF